MDNTATTALSPAAPVLDVKNEAGFSLADLAIVIPAIVIAAFYLYIKIWKNGGKCGGCGNKGCTAKAPRNNAGAKVEITTLPPKTR